MLSEKDKKVIAEFLKDLITTEGFEYLSNHAYDVYRKMLKEEIINQQMCGVFLLTFLNDTIFYVKDTCPEKDEVSNYIQKKCFLKKGIADQISDVYLMLFNEDNLEKWKDIIRQGFKEFCNKQWQFSWKCEDAWYSSGVHVECIAEAAAKVIISDKLLLEKELKGMLKKNPFTSSEKIHLYFQDKLCEELDSDFHYYVVCEDYYPPVCEDYYSNYECLVKEFCDKYGLELVDYEFDGDTSNYIPNY